MKKYLVEGSRVVIAASRVVLGIAEVLVAIPLIALQGLVVARLFQKYPAVYNFIPNQIYNTMRRLFGMKVEFNAASAPVVKDKPVWFVANHMAVADFIALGSTLNGTFAGKGDILKWPIVADMARAVKYIGLRRSKEFNPQSRAKIIKNFNAGFNTIMFPEGTTTDGKKVGLFRAALPEILYGEKGIDKDQKEVTLDKEVGAQPVAIRVKKVEGKDATGNDELRNLYSMPQENNMFKMAWKLMKIRGMTLELTAFAPLNPKDFSDAKALMNRAALDIASVVNPGQTTFEKAAIPGQEKKVVALAA